MHMGLSTRKKEREIERTVSRRERKRETGYHVGIEKNCETAEREKKRDSANLLITV